MGSLGYEAVNFTVTNLRLEPLNASSPPTWWDGSPAEGTEPGGQQRLTGAYRVFNTTILVFILLTSLLCKSNIKARRKLQISPAYYIVSLFTPKSIHKNMLFFSVCWHFLSKIW